MKLPNKVIPYRKSVISKFPLVLKELEKNDYSVGKLYNKIGKKLDGPDEFVRVLDCLFCLGEIELRPGGDMLHYVKGNIL